MSARTVSDVRAALSAVAWRDFIVWAQTQKDVVAQFNAETGRRYLAPRSLLDALIDQASGHETKEAEAFVEWVTVNLWGLDEAPAAYRERLAGRKAPTP